MFLGPQGLIILIIAMVAGLLTQSFVNSAYRKNSRIPLPAGLTGAAVARRVLDAEGLDGVAIEMIPGKLTDHYDPRADVLRLSADVYNGQHVSAAGIAAHEAGHAVQHARGFLPARLRMSLVPVAGLGSQSGPILVMLGLILGYGSSLSTMLIGPRHPALRRCGVVPVRDAAGGVRRVEAGARGTHCHRFGRPRTGIGSAHRTHRRGAHVRCLGVGLSAVLGAVHRSQARLRRGPETRGPSHLGRTFCVCR